MRRCAFFAAIVVLLCLLAAMAFAGEKVLFTVPTSIHPTTVVGVLAENRAALAKYILNEFPKFNNANALEINIKCDGGAKIHWVAKSLNNLPAHSLSCQCPDTDACWIIRYTDEETDEGGK